MALDPYDKPTANIPPERTEKLGEHTVEQAEKLLSEPMLIPRNPIAVNVRLILLALTSDLIFLLVLLLFFAGLAFMRTNAGAGLFVLLIALLVIKSTIMALLLIKMSSNWSEVSYFLTERGLVVRKGIVNVYEDTFELANIRGVKLFQDFIGRMYDYGHIQLTIATRGMETIVRLTDLKDPEHYKTLLEKYLG